MKTNRINIDQSFRFEFLISIAGLILLGVLNSSDGFWLSKESCEHHKSDLSKDIEREETMGTHSLSDNMKQNHRTEWNGSFPENQKGQHRTQHSYFKVFSQENQKQGLQKVFVLPGS